MTASHGVFLATTALGASWCLWMLVSGLSALNRRRRRRRRFLRPVNEARG